MSMLEKHLSSRPSSLHTRTQSSGPSLYSLFLAHHRHKISIQLRFLAASPQRFVEQAGLETGDFSRQHGAKQCTGTRGELWLSSVAQASVIPTAPL